jgi:hypothetical protein
MEELQSTEILDREILEDARKKAHQILKAAEATVKAKTEEWEKKLKADLAELEKKYARQAVLSTDEIMTRLPMDRRRIKARRIEELLHSAVETWYAGLSRDRVLDLLKKEITKRLATGDAIADKIQVRIHKIEQKEAEAILKEVLPGRPFVIEKIHSAAEYPEIILDTKEIRIYASLNKMIDFFLGEKREELVEALLGNAALTDQAEAEGEKS